MCAGFVGCVGEWETNRDVPSFLQYPDGSHSLGVISPLGERDEDEAGAANDSGAITGSFIVWAGLFVCFD